MCSVVPSVNGHPASPSQLVDRLLPQHRADLYKSGLSDEQIDRCGFLSYSLPESVQKVLRWKRYDGRLGPCLAIPFADAEGKPTGYCRLKPDTPRTAGEDGKPVKYESPKRSTNQAYLPPGTRAALSDASVPLVITEGEKKAAKADQEGFPTVGLVGVYGWQKKRRKDKDGKPEGERQLIDGLDTIPWQGRTVYVCYDSDAAENRNVRNAEYHLAETLARHGATVKVVRLPPGDPGPDGKPAKVGLDDFLVAQGPDAFRELLAAAKDAAPTEKGLAPIEAPDDPHRLARLFVGEHGQLDGVLILRRWLDEWHRWDGSAYRAQPESELRAELTRVVKTEMDRINVIAQKLADDDKPPVARKVTGRLIADVAHALTSLTLLPSAVKPPAWLEGDGPFPASEVLPCRNGLVHLPSLVAAKDHLQPPTPRFFSGNCLNFDFDLNAPAPAAWLGFLGKLWPEDPESVATLGEWFGYLLTPDTRQQKILLMVGPKRSGKGTIARVLTALLGRENVAGPTLSSLSGNFGLQPLLGKTAAIVSDARLSGRSDIATVTERLLSISGEDAPTVDRKYLTAITTQLSARFVICTNELPRLGDSSGALAGRMIVLRLTESWYGREDTRLTDKLLEELPGILLWAVEGWRRLNERGHFKQPESGRELVEELEDLASPVGAFVRECCEVGPGRRVTVEVIFTAWRTWCNDNGRHDPGTQQVFGRDLLAALPSVRKVRPREGDQRCRAYEGVCVRT